MLLTEQVAATHTALDAEVAAALEDCRRCGVPIHCRRGCANCCRLAVHATWPEAQFLATHLSSPQQKALSAHVEGLRTLVADCEDLREYLRRYRDTLAGCPFLDPDGGCGVYALRPLSCRALQSTRPGAWCGIDLSTLPALDKQLYLSSLDPDLVDYPTHYLARPRGQGQAHELELLATMAGSCGFTLAGNLAALTWLALQRLEERFVDGHAAIRARLLSLGLPEWLVRVEGGVAVGRG